jgi:VWFA-related protein
MGTVRPAAPAALLLGLAGLLAAPAAAQEPSRKGSITAKASVEKVLVDAYVLGSRGGALLGLTPSDFLLKVGGEEVPVEEVEFIPADRSELPPRKGAVPEAKEPGTPEFPQGRLIVLFFQADFSRNRLVGHMRMANEMVAFLDRLLPTDRVAVLSYDSHLKLRLDFTNDRAAIHRALFETLRIGGAPDPPPASPFPSLAAHFDVESARKAANVERGLYVTAKALEGIPGGKVMFFLGWGLHVNRSPTDWKWHALAVNALQQARVNVFTLDVSDADWHTLEVTLMRLADLTGGTYAKTHVFSTQALELAFRAIEGRYVVVFTRPDRPPGRHSLDLSLRAKKGRVLARPFFDDP